jgi:hypothetical protein
VAASPLTALLLGAADRVLGLTRRFAACFKDSRNSDFVEHSVQTLVTQRIVGIAFGYEDTVGQARRAAVSDGRPKTSFGYAAFQSIQKFFQLVGAQFFETRWLHKRFITERFHGIPWPYRHWSCEPWAPSQPLFYCMYPALKGSSHRHLLRLW